MLSTVAVSMHAVEENITNNYYSKAGIATTIILCMYIPWYMTSFKAIQM